MLATSELEALLVALRAHGVKRYRDGGLELELHASDQGGSFETQAEPAKPETAEQRKDRQAREAAEEDALLFASAGGN